MSADSISDVTTRLKALRAARDSGVLMVRHDNTTTQFRSLAEINQIIATLEAQMTALKPGQFSTRKPGYIWQTRKGL